MQFTPHSTAPTLFVILSVFLPLMPSWISKLIKQPREIAAISPSSHLVGRAMADQIQSTDTVLELGPGTGTLTKEILTALPSPSQLTSIEQEQELAEHCRKHFPHISVIHADALAYLNEHPQPYDVIASGIPFTALSRDQRQQWFRIVHQRLNPGGRFLVLQYSRTVCEDLKNIFGNLETRRIWMNLPPAFVFTCRK